MTSLSSLAARYLEQHQVKVWYTTSDSFRHLSFLDIADASERDVFTLSLGDSHKEIGSFFMNKHEDKSQILEKIFIMMQGENWSPKGEARDIILSAGVHHTSMSPGDIVQVDDEFFSCDSIGFSNITELVKHSEKEKRLAAENDKAPSHSDYESSGPSM